MKRKGSGEYMNKRQETMENDKADLENENTITFRNKNIIIEYKND